MRRANAWGWLAGGGVVAAQQKSIDAGRCSIRQIGGSIVVLRAVVLGVLCVVGLSAPIGPAGSAQAVTLDIRGGELFGATGVVVGGTTFDVAFVDASCVAVYDGCDSLDDFDFADLATARLAAEALADQVLRDLPGNLFDTTPSLTNGCAGSGSLDTCGIAILVALETENRVSGLVFFNTSPGSALGDDPIFGFSLARDRDLTELSRNVYAKFTAVPVPAALPLMLGGLGLLALVGRRRRG